MATIGQTLGNARQDRGLSIDDVAYRTRIHPNMIQGIEEDDFSMFASVAYAKSFIRKYADLLEVDLTAAMQALNSGVAVRLSDNELMGEMGKTIKKDRIFRIERGGKRRRPRLVKSGGSPIFLNLILTVLIGAMAIFYFLGFNAESPEEAKAEIARGFNRANPFVDDVEEAFPPHPLGGALVATPIEISEEGTVVIESPPAGKEMSRDILAIEKPEVDWKVEEDRPGPLVGDVRSGAEFLKPRSVPKLPLETNISASPLRSADLKIMNQTDEEPQAALKPLGADASNAPPGPAQGTREDREGAGPIRAVPVASGE
tara:strand:- start:3362 stop:4306 length:945 start_codon:yes stop_codon:yes gene_type:complete